MYERQTGERRTRSGSVYKRTRTVGEPLEGSHYASVVYNGEHRVRLHSKVYKHVETPLPATFLATLRYFTNQKMWDFMHLDDDGEWISEAILNGTLDVAHAGLYQPETCKDVFSTVVWVRCRATKKQIVVSFAEKSSHA